MKEMRIAKITGREILDSRGNPTIEADVYLEGGATGTAAVPSGASTGEHEAWELRDGDPARYQGKGVTKAVNNIRNIIAPALIGLEATEQTTADALMRSLDGTFNKSKLGANAILGVSLALAKAAAEQLQQPLYRYLGGPNAKVLPVPMMNIINGGAHSDAPIDFQEFMIVPSGAPTFREALRYGAEVFHALKSVLHGRGLSTAVGDEGGFAPNLDSAEDALDCIAQAVEKAGYRFGEDIAIALDVASSEFYDPESGLYVFKKSDGSRRTAEELTDYYVELKKKYPIVSIEDGCAENDWDGWKILTDKLGKNTQLVGDDLFVTNVEFLRKGIERRCANSILVKVNQIGTISEALEMIQYAYKFGYAVMPSDSRGEGEAIADYAVGINAGSVRECGIGPRANRFMEIEAELGKTAKFLGARGLKGFKNQQRADALERKE